MNTLNSILHMLCLKRKQKKKMNSAYIEQTPTIVCRQSGYIFVSAEEEKT